MWSIPHSSNREFRTPVVHLLQKLQVTLRAHNDTRRRSVMSWYLSLQFKFIFHLFTNIFTIYRYITNSQRDQLPSWLDSSVGESLGASVSQRSWVRIPVQARITVAFSGETYPENHWPSESSAMVGNAFLMRDVLTFVRCKSQITCSVKQWKGTKKLIATLNPADYVEILERKVKSIKA